MTNWTDARAAWPADTAAFFTRLRDRGRTAASDMQPAFRAGAKILYAERTRDLIEMVRDSTCTFQKEPYGYVDALLREIATRNQLQVDPILLLSENPASNASSYGNGIFVVNTGLLLTIESREELAFVLSHELAHDQLGHTAWKIQRRAGNYREGESARRRARRLRRERRKQSYQKQHSTFRRLLYADKRQSRLFELAADSLGATYLQRADFPEDAIKSSLKLLAAADTAKMLMAVGSAINPPAYPFRKEWVAPKKAASLFGGSFGTTQEIETDSLGFWIKDSLSTHPSMSDRLTSAPAISQEETSFTSHGIQAWAAEEIIRYYLRENLPGQAICQALEQQEGETRDVALLYALYLSTRAMQEKNFGRAVPPVSFYSDAPRRSVLRFLHKLDPGQASRLTEAYADELVHKYPSSSTVAATVETVRTYLNSI